MSSALAPTTTAVTIVETIDAMTVIVMIVTGEMTATVAMIAMLVAMTVPLTDANALGPLLIALIMTIVDHPGLLRPGENMMIRGLRVSMIDGTMTDEEVIMMIEEHLTLTMTVVGMMTGVGTTDPSAKKRTIATMSDPQDTLTEMVAGRVDFGLMGS